MAGGTTAEFWGETNQGFIELKEKWASFHYKLLAMPGASHSPAGITWARVLKSANPTSQESLPNTDVKGSTAKAVKQTESTH